MFYLILFTGALYTIMYRKELWKESVIPLIIWQTYETEELPKNALQCQQTWVKSGLTYNFLNDFKISRFIQIKFRKDVFNTFEKLPLGVMKADLWRYCVLYQYGGIYSDIDTILVKPVDEWGIKSNNKVIIGLENDIHFCQWTIASVPEHPLFTIVINMIVSKFKKGIDFTNPHFVHAYTGPGIWTRAINKLLNEPENQKAIDTYNKTKRDLLDKYGISLKPPTFFSRICVEHLYGSTQFSDGYKSWISERNNILKNAISK